MYSIDRITEDSKKKEISNLILRQLPEWFGIEQSLIEYVDGVYDTDFYVSYCNEIPVGFISVKYNNRFTAEIYVVGILKEHHHRGMGKKLIHICEEELRRKGIVYFMVKTLGESHPDQNYKDTRNFYTKVGFYPLQEINEIWGNENPCLIMVKNIGYKEVVLSKNLTTQTQTFKR